MQLVRSRPKGWPLGNPSLSLDSAPCPCSKPLYPARALADPLPSTQPSALILLSLRQSSPPPGAPLAFHTSPPLPSGPLPKPTCGLRLPLRPVPSLYTPSQRLLLGLLRRHPSLLHSLPVPGRIGGEAGGHAQDAATKEIGGQGQGTPGAARNSAHAFSLTIAALGAGGA